MYFLQPSQLKTERKHKVPILTFNFVIVALLVRNHSSPEQAKSHEINLEYLWDWEGRSYRGGVLYRSDTINAEDVNRLVLLETLQEDGLRSYHNDLGHQRHDRLHH